MKEIDFRVKFLEMFPDNYIKKIPDNATICDNCQGIGWHNKVDGFISLCNKCYGKGYIETKFCECGKEILYHGDTKCNDCKQKEFKIKQQEKELIAYEKANKISFEAYSGKFWIDSWDYVKDKDDLEEWLYDLISEGEDCPTWIWGTNKIKCLNIDIADVIYDACENGDGYEEMYDNLNLSTLKPIQEQIDKWLEEQGDSIYTYGEDYGNVVLLDDLIEEIKKEIKEKL